MNFFKKLFHNPIKEEIKIYPEDLIYIHEPESPIRISSTHLSKREEIRAKKDKLIDEKDLSSKQRIQLRPYDTASLDQFQHSIFFKVLRNDLVNAEKSIVELLAKTDNIYDKFCIVDEFSRFPNGMMSRDIHTWIQYTSIELYWLLYNLDIGLRYKSQALYYILRADIDAERKLKAIHDMETIIDSIHEDIPDNILSDLYDTLMKTGMIEATTLAASILKIIRHREDETTNKKTIDYQLNKRLEESIYSNGQNVHAKPIEESVARVIDQLAEDVYFQAVDIDSDTAVIERENPMKTVDEIDQVLSELGLMNERIRKSLNRICIDTAVFSRYQYRTRDILQKVWMRIKYRISPTLKDDAIKYLAEELKESSDICSSGFTARIVNVLSRFEPKDGGIQVITITWKDQMKSNIEARLKNRIQSSPQYEEILLAMIDNKSSLYKDFIDGCRESIHDELKAEFIPHISDAMFEQIFTECYLLLNK